MSQRTHYPTGVPCFVDSLAADVPAALRFYAGVFDWEFDGPGPMPGDPPGSYYVARIGGDDVAGVGSVPAGASVSPGWNTHVAVTDAAEAGRRAQAAGGTVVTEAFDAPPAGRLAVITDPAGAPLCLWQANRRAGARRVNEPSAWAMSLLHTPDPEQAERFYGELFGWRAEPFGEGMWLFRLDGYVGGEPEQPVPRDVVAAMMRDPDHPAAWSVDFWVADAEGASAAAAEEGGTVVAGPLTEAGFRRAVLAAPDGATFTVSQLLRDG